MKVTVISNYFPPDFVGGAEIYAYRLTKEMVKLGVQCEIITSTKHRPEINEEEGMKVYRVTKPLPLEEITLNLFGYNFNPSALRMKKLLEKTSPDIIHIHHISSTIMLYPLVRYLKNSVIVHLHDHWPICYRGVLYNMRDNTICDENCIRCCFRPGFRPIGRINLAIRKKLIPSFESKVSCFISPSSYLRNKLIRDEFTIPEKISHVHLGIDISQFVPSRDHRNDSDFRRILFIGRLVSYKNPTFIVKLMPKLLKEVNCTYQVVGNGSEMNDIIYEAKKLGVERNIELLGKVTPNSIVKIISNADVFVLPSLCYENSPVSIYESLASGTPAIVSNRGGPKELIDEGKNGFSIDPSNEDEWFNAILKILSDENLRRKMSVEARKKAEREYDITQNAKKILDIYERLAHR
jgi:glycosyltransferase involved in cell wall biosynthesis